MRIITMGMDRAKSLRRLCTAFKNLFKASAILCPLNRPHEAAPASAVP